MSQKKSLLAATLVLVMLFSVLVLPFTLLAEEAEDTPEEEVTAEEEEEVWVAPEPKPVVLVVSFGTSYNDNRALTIGALEEAVAKAFPDYEMRRAFTSSIIINKLHARDGERIDNVTQALYRLLADGVKDVIVVPTHVMQGYEYDDTIAEIKPFVDKFESLQVSSGLLMTDEDYKTVAQILVDHTEDANQEDTAIVWMGHGTSHAANATYGKMDQVLKDLGHSNYFIGTVEGTPTLEDTLTAIQAGNYSKVVLLPFMIVAGDHANNDMSGDEPDSWKSQFEGAGFDVECRLEGMGSYTEIQDLIIEHAKAAVNVADLEDEPAEAGEEKAASHEGPVTADMLQEGSYEINVESSSSMFNIVKAELTVADGKMTCAMTMSGKGYLYLFMGTGEEAAAASEDAYIPFEEVDDEHVFTVPVEALDQETDCAAFSKRKETWYDRTLVFSSEMLPEEAYANK